MPESPGLSVLLVGTDGKLAAALRADRHRVADVADSVAALRSARIDSHDVVVLSLDLPRPFLTARELRAACWWRKPMFIALGPADSDEACRDAGIDLLLVPPVDPAFLTGFINRLGAVVAEYDSFDPSI
jgi:DNA-binding response OmpR family regulator